MKKDIWIYAGLIWCLVHANAQVRDRYPSQYFQYYNNLTLINPAESCLNEKISINAGNQFFTGDFNNIGSYYATGSYVFSGNDSSVAKQALALRLMGEREGSIFSTTRLYASYALRRKLSYKYELALGLAAGMASYVIQVTPNSPGGSAQAFDGNVGISILSRHFKLGLAVNQFANSSLTPLVEKLVLRRFYEAYAQHVWEASASIQLKSILHTRFQPSLPVRPDLTEVLIFKDMIALGLTYTLQRHYGFLVGLEKIPAIRGNLKFYFSYHLPVKNTMVAQNMNILVLGMAYRF